ncbi:MAG: hypothetical protein K9N46_06400 [Candidatus Marinimicrobia bacterium]|nr:hypothetical protein [Candidatus Neomarinimicrobiota bacterium]MCF7828610.1 hypothetical protein [Candidatus Neomarinimicrobiota bacterium]MCF7880351.1 hypothetical protein [Candidatus Neomarinimicrobiota bacterium]
MGAKREVPVSQFIPTRPKIRWNAPATWHLNRNFKKPYIYIHRVYEDSTLKSEYRADALYHMGSLHGNFFNDNRDLEKAHELLTRLVNDFPLSDFRDRAEKRIAEIERQMANTED